MASSDSSKWTHELMDLQTQASETFGLRYNNKGVLVFSQRGLNKVQKEILEGLIDDRLEKGVYSLKVEKEKAAEWKKRAEDGYTYIDSTSGNKPLIFYSYQDERDFFRYLNKTLEMVDFFYDPEMSRDYIYNGYTNNVSPEDVAKSLREGLHEPKRVTPPKGGGKYRIWNSSSQ